MRFLLSSLMLGFLSLTACSNSTIIENVNAQTFQKLIKENEGIILDVRTPREVMNGYIDGASTADISDRNSFVSKINVMQKNKPIYVYCYSGSRSTSAARILSQNGFTKVYNLSGGILAWNRSGFTLVKPTENTTNNSVSYSVETFNKILENNKPVIVDFHAIWCAPCKKMAPIFDNLSKKYNSKIEFKKIDISANAEIAKEYNIESVPAFVIYKNGKAVWKQNGIITSEELSEAIERFL